MDADLQPEPKSGVKSSRRAGIVALYLTKFAVGLGLAMLAAYIPEYAKLLDATPYWIGLFTTGFALASTLTVLPAGWISDRHDKRTVLIVGLVSSLASYVVFLWADSVQLVTLGRIFQGIGMSTVGLTVLSLVASLAPDSERGMYIGTLNAVGNFSSGFGAILGGWLYGLFGFVVPYTLMIVLTSAAIVLAVGFIPRDSTRVREITFGPLLRSRRVQAMSAFRIPYAFAVMLTRTYVPIYVGVVLGFSALEVGLVLAAEKLVNMAGQRFTGILSDVHGRFPLVLLGGTLYGLGAAAIPAQTSLVGLCLVNGFLGAADSLREPASMALFADEGSRLGGIASSFSVRNIIWRPGSVLAPMVGSFLMAEIGIHYVFYAAVGFSVLAVFGIPSILSFQNRLSRETLLS